MPDIEAGNHGQTVKDGVRILAKGGKLIYKDLIRPIVRNGVKVTKKGIKTAKTRRRSTIRLDEE